MAFQELAVHVQNTSTHLQLVSNSLNALAAAPLPPLGAPQWALDMQNLLCHEQKWDFHIIKILIHNSDIFQREQAEWNVARFLNSSCDQDGEPLTALPLPIPRIAIPAIPPTPAPGAAQNLPPPFAPPPIVVPGPHALFPANKGALRTLTTATLATLFTAYNWPGQNAGGVGNQRRVFARYIGVTL